MLPSADDAERLVADLGAGELGALPLAGAQRRVGLRDLARQREHQRDRVLGGGDVVAAGRVHHHDAALGRGRDVDVVDADAGAADDLQLAVPASMMSAVTLRAAADDQRVVFADDRARARRASCRAVSPSSISGLRRRGSSTPCSASESVDRVRW